MSLPVTDDPVTATVGRHRASMLWVAQMHSFCLDDAHDAVQRAIEIYLERRDTVRPSSAGAWLRRVCKHEALHIRAARERMLLDQPWEWDATPATDPADGEDAAAARQLVDRAADALRSCKPDEQRALLLRADGCSYQEIGTLTGWSYTKTNRLVSEGRARFLSRYRLIESGAACFAHERRLSAVVDGEATVDDWVALRPHLKHCGGCRGVLRSLYAVEPVVAELACSHGDHG